jgi:hypothetical protein
MKIGDDESYLVGERVLDGYRFVSLNSAWFAKDDDDEKKLWLGLPHLRVLEAAEQLPSVHGRSDARCTVALVHHPKEWLHPQESNAWGSRPNTWDYLARRCHILLTGHTHGEVRRADRIAEGPYHFTGGSAYAGASHFNSFRLIRVETEQLVYLSFEFDPRSAENKWKALEEVRLLLGTEPSAAHSASVGFGASKYAGTIQRFFESFLVTDEGPIPFGGRDQEFEILDRWLDDEQAAARFVLAAPGGRGKSTLLVHWMNRLVKSGQVPEAIRRWNLAFAPISMLFGTNLPNVFYEAIAARLAEILGKELEPARSEAHYRNRCTELLEDAIAQQRPILLVIDGLDEVLGGSFDASWFPLQRGQPPVVRILVSARLQLGDHDARGWVERLGWGRNRGVRVQTHELRILDPEDVADLLRKTGAPVLASRPEIIDRIYKLSKGEPLLLRLYAEDLSKRDAEAARLTIQDLDRIKPGISGYFDDWMRRQRDAWRLERKEGVVIDEETLKVYLAVLACAYGPLTAEELGELVRQVHGLAPGFRVEDALDPLRRFVIGVGRSLQSTEAAGYVLSHPQFGDFLRKEHLDRSPIERTRQAFAQWGRDILRQLNQGGLEPSRAPAYLLQSLVQHLADVGAPETDFMALVEEGWLRAWERFEGGYAGFSRDVERVREIVAKNVEGQSVYASQLRCRLVLSSIFSVAKAPPLLLALCVQLGVMSLREALFRAPLLPDASQRAEALARLGALGPGKDWDGRLAEALNAVRAIGDYWVQARALIKILTFLYPALKSPEGHVLPGERRASVPYLSGAWVANALGVARDLPPDETRARALEALTPWLSLDLLEKAEHCANEIAGADPVAHFLARVGIFVQKLKTSEPLPTGWKDFLRDSLNEIARLLSLDSDKAKALKLLGPHLPDDLVSNAIEVAGSMNVVEFASTLSVFLEHGKKVPDDVLARLLDYEKLDVSDREYAQVVAALAPYLSRDRRRAVAARALPKRPKDDKYAWLYWYPDSAWRMALLAPYVAKEQRDSVCAEALEILASTIFKSPIFPGYHDDTRCRALVELAPHLPERLFDAALRVCSNIHDLEQRAQALDALTKKFKNTQREALRTALKAALAEVEADTYQRAETLAALVPLLAPDVPDLPDDEVKRILKAVDASAFEARFELIGALAGYLRGEQRGRLLDLDQALEDALELAHKFSKNKALAALIPYLPDLDKAHTAARKVAVKDDARALAALASRLEGDARRAAVRTALRAAKAAGRELADHSGQMLCDIVSFLEPNQVSSAAQLMRQLPPAWRNDVLLRAREAAKERHDGGPARLLEALAPGLHEEQFSGRADQPTATGMRRDEQQRTELNAALKTWPQRVRSDALRDIRKYARTLAQIGGGQMIRETIRAVCDTASWWP